MDALACAGMSFNGTVFRIFTGTSKKTARYSCVMSRTPLLSLKSPIRHVDGAAFLRQHGLSSWYCRNVCRFRVILQPLRIFKLR